jgi:biotin carboxyl carrier protein
MKRYRVTLEGHTFDVKVLDDPRRERVQVEVNGETFVVGVETVPVVAEGTIGEAAPAGEPSPATPMPIPGGAATAGVGQVVTAPLPGVIKFIAVQPGQQVTPNDELLVIEAMKMDNVICAQRAGTIGTIYVTEGRQVAYGEAMLDFED